MADARDRRRTPHFGHGPDRGSNRSASPSPSPIRTTRAPQGRIDGRNIPRERVKEPTGYQRTEYDQRRHETQPNEFPHFNVETEARRAHFLHARSPETRHAAAPPSPTAGQASSPASAG
ncbi:epoxide hydrolase N-terminal domain-containing protein [Actinomadura sp. NBRC 104425]|uniref:epoxide hydrolase N-terminal domain-containing protein n=1 Tax=Actinomadura sp. NBRC 104425 TaxID=3032204 RepID=UPI003318E5BD